MGFRLVTSARCGGGFFAGFASGFRWCLAVLSRSPGGCCFGRVWARLRCVLCPRAGACFFSFMGFRLVTSARCGGGFFAGFASGFRWCLAVLSRWPGGCCFGRVWARLRCVLCPRAGACFFSFMGFRLVTSARCGGGFFAGFASGFRWCLAVLSLGCVAFCVHVLVQGTHVAEGPHYDIPNVGHGHQGGHPFKEWTTCCNGRYEHATRRFIAFLIVEEPWVGGSLRMGSTDAQSSSYCNVQKCYSS